ncbi:uncharacterized protein LOC120831293 isoform X1 [Gasterosteus aculeatus]
MNGFTVMLLFAAQGFPVTASQGGNKSAQLFFCSIPGCGSNVTHVFCNDESLLSDGPIPNCTGPPPPNTVCQHKGFAFASTDSDAGCDFEGKDGLIESGKCTDNRSICASLHRGFHRPSLTTAFPLVNATSQVPTRGRYGFIVGVVISGLLIVGIAGRVFYRRSQQDSASNAADRD